MNKSSIRKLRLQLVEELKGYEGVPVRLDLDKDVLEEILFDHYEFGKKEGWKEFASELNNDYLPCDILRKIDYTGISFKGMRGSHILNGAKGITINPQEIYRKDLEGANLNGVMIELDERGFDGCRLFCTNFKGAKLKDGGLITINPQKIANITLARCVFDGVKFEGSFAGANINGADFRGSMGAVIDPQTLREESLESAKLGNVKFINNFVYAYVGGADFTGSVNAVINPQTIAMKSLTNTKLTDAYVIGEEMDGVILYNTDFTNAKGQIVINPQTIANRCLAGCKLSGVKLTGPLDNCLLLHTNFTGSNGGYFISSPGNIDSETNFTDVDTSGIHREEEELHRAKTLIKKSIYG